MVVRLVHACDLYSNNRFFFVFIALRCKNIFLRSDCMYV